MPVVLSDVSSISKVKDENTIKLTFVAEGSLDSKTDPPTGSLTFDNKKSIVSIKLDRYDKTYDFQTETSWPEEERNRAQRTKRYRSLDIPVRFDYSTFRKRARFVGRSKSPLDLSMVSFKGVALTFVEFNNVKWSVEKVMFFFTRYVVVDEKVLDKYENYRDVSQIYNQLRKNYESRLAFDEASNFFVGEMEAVRKRLRNGTWKDKLASVGYSVYKYMGLYSENAALPLIFWTSIIIVVFAALRLLIGECFSLDTQSAAANIPLLSTSNLSDHLESAGTSCSPLTSLIDSFASYFQFPRTENALDTIERIVSIPFLGTAFIALRRKFERKN